MTDTHEVAVRADQVPAKQALHPAVEQALAQNPTADTLREILALQREWEAGEAKRAFAQAMVDLKTDLPLWIEKDARVDYESSKGRVRYSHTSLAHAMETILPHLTKHGFSISWKTATENNKVKVTARLLHRLGHQEETVLDAAPDMSGNKSGPQGVASTITLLERYSAMALLGLASRDMREPGDDAQDEAAALERIDTQRNLRALRAIKEKGHTKEQAEQHVGKPMPQWTIGDLDKLREWLKS